MPTNKLFLTISLVIRISLLLTIPFSLLFDTGIREVIPFFLFNLFAILIALQTALRDPIIRADARAQVLMSRLVITSLLVSAYLLNFAPMRFYNAKIRRRETEEITLETFNFESPYKVRNKSC